MDFTGKDSTALCKLLKSKEDLGKNLVDHFDHDRGGVQFIEEAFKGTRGLNAEGQADVGDVPLPIRGITHKEFTQLGKDWLAALGSGDGRIGFHDGDCGCVQHHYALKIHSEVTVAAGPVSVDNNTAARDPVIPIVFNDDRTFSTKPGTATDPLKIGFPLPCVASGVSMISVSATGSFSNQPTVINLSDGTQSEETEALLVMLTGTPQLKTWIGTSSPLESLPWFKPFPMVQSAASIAVVKVD
jgi:hypothetical protein